MLPLRATPEAALGTTLFGGCRPRFLLLWDYSCGATLVKLLYSKGGEGGYWLGGFEMLEVSGQIRSESEL